MEHKLFSKLLILNLRQKNPLHVKFYQKAAMVLF